MATKKNNPPTNRLAEIVAYRRSQGGSVTGSIAGGLKERLKEKFDPRQLINQRGLLAALFPGLKAYQAKTGASEITKSSLQSTSFDEIKPILETISYNTKMTAKNTMVLPALHRDVNVMRQNIVKLVKLKGGDARTKADMYFMKAKEREDKYEREIKKETNKKNKIEKLKEKEEDKSKGFLLKAFSAIIKGLNLIVKSILSLGKAILGAFKFIATVFVNTISTVIKSLFNIASLLIPDLSDMFEKFFKGGKFLTTIFRIVIGSIFRTMFTRTFLGRLGLALVSIIASLLGIKYTQGALLEKRIREQPVSTKEEIRRLEEIEKYQTLPTDKSETGKPMRGGLDTSEKRQEYLDSSKSIWSFGGKNPLSKDIRSTYYEEILNEFLGFERTLYQIRIPGLQSPYGEGVNVGREFFLTRDEAIAWGQDQKELKRLYNQLLYFEGKEKKTPEELNKMKNIVDQIKILKQNMLLSGAKLVNEQIKNEDIKQAYMGAINSALKNEYPDAEDIMLRNAVDDVMNFKLVKDELSAEEKRFEEIKKSVKFPTLEDVRSSIKSNLSTATSELRTGLETARKEFIDPLIDKTFDNRRQSVVFTKQPIIINQENKTKNSLPYGGLGTPASAWNNEFLSKYVSDMMIDPLKNINY